MFTPPNDYENPNWNESNRCHDWKNYIHEKLQSYWEHFTSEQKAVIAENAQELADAESGWDRKDW